MYWKSKYSSVIPAKAGIHGAARQLPPAWIPAFAGMTGEYAGMTGEYLESQFTHTHHGAESWGVFHLTETATPAYRC